MSCIADVMLSCWQRGMAACHGMLLGALLGQRCWERSNERVRGSAAGNVLGSKGRSVVRIVAGRVDEVMLTCVVHCLGNVKLLAAWHRSVSWNVAWSVAGSLAGSIAGATLLGTRQGAC